MTTDEFEEQIHMAAKFVYRQATFLRELTQYLEALNFRIESIENNVASNTDRIYGVENVLWES